MYTKANIHELLEPQDVNLRLGGSILQHKITKHAIYVKSHERMNMYPPKYSIQGFDINTQTPIDRLYAWDLILRSPPTGFINVHNQTKLVLRRPVKKFKIGLTEANTTIVDILTRYKENFHAVLSYPALSQMIENQYPTANEALERLQKDQDHQSIACAKNLCFSKGKLDLITLLHYTEVIGWIPPGEKKVYLGKQYNHHSYHKYLQKCGVNTYA